MTKVKNNQTMLGVEIVTFILKIFGPTTTIGKWVIKKWGEKHYHLFHAIKALKLDSGTKDFDAAYFAAVKKYKETGVPTELGDLFMLASIKEAFKDEFYAKGLPSGVRDQVHVQMHLKNDQYAPYKTTIDGDTQCLRLLIIKEVQDSRTPVEAQQDRKLDDIVEAAVATQGKMDAIYNYLVDQGMPDSLLQGPLQQQGIQLDQGTRLVPQDFDGEINDIIDLFESNQNQLFIDQTTKYKNRKWDDLSSIQKYKIEATIGAAYFRLGKHSEASSHFTGLPLLRPNNHESIALAALGYSIINDRENSEKLIAEALKLNPHSANAIVAGINNLADDATLNQILAAAPQDIVSLPSIANSIALHLNAHPNHYREEALQILNRIEFGDEVDEVAFYETSELKANILSAKTIDEYTLAGNALTAEMRASLGQAIDLYTECWEFYQHSDMRKSKWHVLANRGICRNLTGDIENAEIDFALSIHEKKTYFTYLHRIQAKMSTGMPILPLLQEVESTLILDQQQKEELFFLRLMELMRLGQYGEVLGTIEIERQFTDPLAESKIMMLKVHALKELGRTDEAASLMTSYAEKHPEDIFAQFNAAELSIAIGEIGLGLLYLQKAERLIDKDTSIRVIDYISALLYQQEQYQSVIRILNQDNFKIAESILTLRLLDSLMRINQYDQAFNIADPLFKNGSMDPLVWKVIIEEKEQKGNQEKLLVTINKAITQFESDSYFYAKKIAYLLRNNSLEDVSVYINSIKSQFPEHELVVMLHNAERWNNFMTFEKSLELSYQIRFNSSSEEVSGDYQAFLVDLANNGIINASESTVSNNKLVQLQHTDGRIWSCVIENTPTQPNSYSVNSLIGKTLLGKKLMDTLAINDQPHRIIKIVSKYLIREVKRKNEEN